jgi:hypothetical protein
MPTDLSGRVFGRMTVVGPAGDDLVLPQVRDGWWLGRCVCGRETVAPAEAFLSWRITGCGRPTPEDRAELQEQLAATRPPPRL